MTRFIFVRKEKKEIKQKYLFFVFKLDLEPFQNNCGRVPEDKLGKKKVCLILREQKGIYDHGNYTMRCSGSKNKSDEVSGR